jgi:peptidoglycan/LPS O-acetylase OafA/YrhL
VVAGFDGYRALGVLFVVFSHILLVAGVLQRLSDSVPDTLTLGVIPRIPLTTLFIVSGFVIYLPTVARDGDFGRVSSFGLRRLARILPAYWAVLAVALILLATVPNDTGMPSVGLIAAHLGFLQAPALLFENDYQHWLGFGVVPPVWTLSIEMVFYLVLPFVATWYYRRPFLGLALAAAFAIAWRLVATHAVGAASLVGADFSAAADLRINTYYASQFPTWSLSIAAGMTAAWCYVKARDRWSPEVVVKRAKQGALVALAVLTGLVYLGGHEVATSPNSFNGEFAHQSIVVTLGVPIALAGLFLALVLLPPRWQRPIANGPLRWTADISYGIYLIHFAVIWFAIRELSLSHDGSLLTVVEWCLVVFPASFAYAYVSARFLERPVRRWAHRYGRQAQDTVKPSAPTGQALGSTNR